MRILSVLIVTVVLMSCTVPAFAFDVDETDRVWLQALDFSDGIDPVKPDGESNTFQVYAGNYTSWVRYDLPFSTTVSEVDILVRLSNNSSSALVGCQIRNHQNQVASLTVHNLGKGVYRLTGSTSPVASGPYFELRFNVLTPGTAVTVSSFRIFRASSVGYTISNSSIWYSLYTTAGEDHNQSGWVDDLEDIYSLDEEYVRTYQHQLSFFINPWKSYDYVAVRFNVSGSINSISAFSNSIPIPMEVSVMQLPADPAIMYDGLYFEATSGYGEIFLNPDMTGAVGEPWSTVTITLDLRELSRIQSNTPTIQINGSFDDNQGLHFVESQFPASAPIIFTGYVEYANNNPISYWLKTLGLKVSTGFDTLAAKLDLLIGNSADADDFQDSMESQGQDLEDLAGDLDLVEKPDIDQISVDLGDIVSPDQLTGNTSVLTNIMSNQIFLPMIMISLTLAFCAYALYGKR